MTENAATLEQSQEAVPTYEDFIASRQAAAQPPAEVKEEPSAPTEEAGKTAPESEHRDEDSQEDNDDITPVTPRQLQRRIDRRTKEAAAAKAEAKLYKEQMAQLKAEYEERLKAKPADKPDSAPAPRAITSENFEDQCRRYGVDPENPAAIGLLTEAIADARVKAAFEQHEKKTLEQQEAERQQAFFNEFNAKSKEFSKTHPKFQENLETVTGKVADRPILDVVITNSPDPHGLIDHFGANPTELDRILEMTDVLAVLEIGKIQATLAVKPPETKPPQRTTSPPPPAKSTAAGGRSDTTEAGSYEDYARKRDAELRRR